MEQKFRVESDLLGELQVPAEAYYGAHGAHNAYGACIVTVAVYCIF